MDNGFGKGALLGTILGASVSLFVMNKMSPFQKRKAIRNTKKAISNVKDGLNNIW